MLIPKPNLVNTTNLKAQINNRLSSLWHFLVSFKLTGWLLAILILVFILGRLIPQQAIPVGGDTAGQAWIATLPPLIQLWGEPLLWLGFSHLFQSAWVWLPLALLLLNSLVALAEHTPGSWQRLKSAVPPLDWQHPLAQRTEQSTRLPEAPEKFLDTFKVSLQQKGFYLYESNPRTERLLGAAQRRWVWLAPTWLYSGLILFIIALLLSHYFLQVDDFTLAPQENKFSPLFNGQFRLETVETGPGLSRISYLPAKMGSEPSAPPLELVWNLYWPLIFRQTIIIPWAVAPVLTIEARDASGKLLRLIPSQENLAPAERLNLPLDNPNAPLYFLIPSAGLAFQVTPDVGSADTFNIRVRQGSELSSATEIKAKVGQTFTANQVSLVLSRNHNLRVLARRDAGLPFYLLGLILVVGSGILILGRPPLQLWLIPEVKGRGGQLYSVVEKFGSVQHFPQFLADLNTPTETTPPQSPL